VTHDEDACQNVDDKIGVSDTALTDNGEDDTEDVMSEMMSVPDSETLKDISEALYDDVKAEYVNELDNQAHDTLHAAIHYISVFYQVVRQREKNGVRGRQEIQEEIKRLKKDIGSVSHVQSVVRSAKVMALEWVLGVRDDL